MIKCPYCAEEIQEEASICKHCHKDMKTVEAKQLFKKKLEEQKKKEKQEQLDIRHKQEEAKYLEKLKNEQEAINKLTNKLKDKIELYPKSLRGKITSNIENLTKLENMSNEEIQIDILNKKRSRNIAILRITTTILSLIFSTWLLFIVAVWLHPKKDEFEIFKNRFIDLKNKKLRIALSAILLFIAFISYQTNIQIQAEEKMKQEQIERENTTKLDVNFSPNDGITKEDFIDININAQNIKELTINEEKINIEGKNNITHRFPLILGENRVSIIGLNGDIKREVSRLYTKISIEEYEKKQKEELEKAEAEKKSREELAEIERKNREAQAKIEYEQNIVKERETKISSQFSAWDGSHIKLKDTVKDALKDPKSFEHIETKYGEFKEKDGTYYLGVNMKYRAKNSFGGYVVETYTAFFDLDGNPIKFSERVSN